MNLLISAFHDFHSIRFIKLKIKTRKLRNKTISKQVTNSGLSIQVSRDFLARNLGK
jgi:hypothetical protein